MNGWRAELELTFGNRGGRTVLAGERHRGPLLIQKTLYPEGPSPAHAIVLHPPAGIVGGDSLSLTAHCGAGAHALLTTPGATKWYRSAASASSETRLILAGNSRLEFLPRESIVFSGARAQASMVMDVAADARLIGWDLWCLGRTASGERLTEGSLDLHTELRVSGELRWLERGRIEAGSAALTSAAGLGGQPVFGALWAVGPELPRTVLEQCRSVTVEPDARGALTQLPGVLVARYVGPSTEAAHGWFTALWSLLRPVYLELAPVFPRIWAA